MHIDLIFQLPLILGKVLPRLTFYSQRFFVTSVSRSKAGFSDKRFQIKFRTEPAANQESFNSRSWMMVKIFIKSEFNWIACKRSCLISIVTPFSSINHIGSKSNWFFTYISEGNIKRFATSHIKYILSLIPCYQTLFTNI